MHDLVWRSSIRQTNFDNFWNNSFSQKSNKKLTADRTELIQAYIERPISSLSLEHTNKKKLKKKIKKKRGGRYP